MISPGCVFFVFISVLIVCLSGLIGSNHGHELLGWATGFAIIVAGGTLFYGFVFSWLWWQPDIPPCRKCNRKDDYRTDKNMGKDGIVICACGEKYFLTNWGSSFSPKRFMHYKDDGTTQPYLKHSRFGRWHDDVSA